MCTPFEQLDFEIEIERLREENVALQRENNELKFNSAGDELRREVDTLRKENARLEKRNFILKHKQSAKLVKELQSASHLDGELKGVLIDSLKGELEKHMVDDATTDQLILVVEVMNMACSKRFSEVCEERRLLQEEVATCKFKRKTERDVWRFKMEKLRSERDELKQEVHAVRQNMVHKQAETMHRMDNIGFDTSITLKEGDKEMKAALSQLHTTLQTMSLENASMHDQDEHFAAKSHAVSCLNSKQDVRKEFENSVSRPKMAPRNRKLAHAA